ncbi:DUF202 domain-containing protein [Frankia sp. CNm7]|uniref:DUF202 domain-containing protein n=1 Tax=Frankia nepalensis TaxID=1836974 RepID=A0A937UQH9_9ACTN|nr:DUF202 domain-containing protein [Frankia nepalensis]MBL7502220.1 DUF202 domain-containing protein [Frankia nepalensis]MBL7513048.1 DUF202 domain-containing protein [Frankia nepalensis]MBL7523815.1 DUF202 domain-containing protein [Frankia nepalensis]MBL7628275.1 DUF202 domain-containing protein [Frankia nepalensis]
MTDDRRARAPEPCADAVDPGLQSERTYLSWQRTGLSLAGIGALLAHDALGRHRPLLAGGLLTALAGLLLTARAQRRYRATVAAVRAGRSPTDQRAVAVTAALTTVLCLVGLAAILFS